MFSVNNMPSSTTVLTTYASVAGSMMLFRSMANEFIPYQLQTFISSTFRKYLFNPISTRLTLVIEEVDGLFSRNQVYEAAEIFLRTKITPTIERLKVTKAPRDKNLTLRIEKGQEIIDVYQGIHLKWTFGCSETHKSNHQDDPYASTTQQRSEQRYFELSFHKRHKDLVLESYLPYILNRSKTLKEENRVLRLHTLGAFYGDMNGSGVWGSINLEHPATFDTVAMDPTMKKELMEDLDRFVRRKDFYKKVGKAWKRGYLLYGPPGTGKSSLIAAMANYLHFDIYDLELANLQCNSELRRLLVATNNRSILVIEDIDCSTVEFENRDSDVQYHYNAHHDTKLTLSGLLNFIDGLWSSCGDERIIIFTTNHKDRLDPALLRPGRMDMHIHMSYCTFDGFELLASNHKDRLDPALLRPGRMDMHIHMSYCTFDGFELLASNYLSTDNNNHNEYFGEIKNLMEESQITPAEVAEELMKSEDADIALGGVVKLLKRKKMEENETKTEETECQETKKQRNVKEGETRRLGRTNASRRGGPRRGGLRRAYRV